MPTANVKIVRAMSEVVNTAHRLAPYRGRARARAHTHTHTHIHTHTVPLHAPNKTNAHLRTGVNAMQTRRRHAFDMVMAYATSLSENQFN